MIGKIGGEILGLASGSYLFSGLAGLFPLIEYDLWSRVFGLVIY